MEFLRYVHSFQRDLTAKKLIFSYSATYLSRGFFETFTVLLKVLKISNLEHQKIFAIGFTF